MGNTRMVHGDGVAAADGSSLSPVSRADAELRAKKRLNVVSQMSN